MLRIFLASFLIPLSIYATTSVVPTDTTTLTAYGSRTNGSGYEALVIEAGSDAAVASTPHIVYLPVTSTTETAPKPSEYTMWANPLPQYDDSGTGYIAFDLTMTNDTGTNYYLQLVASNTSGTNYKVVDLLPLDYSLPAGIGTISQRVLVPVSKLCKTASACTLAGTADTRYLVFYLSTSNDLELSTPLTQPSDSSGALFYKVIISNVPPASLPQIATLAPGDERAKANINTGYGILYASKVLFTGYDSAKPAAFPIVAKAEGTYKKLWEDNYADGGEFWIKGLTNDTVYNIAAAYVDKFGFATKFSPTQTVKPLEVEKLLQETTCYLISAGYKKDHYVLDFYRGIRDHFLMQFSLGQHFVQLYYETAPRYALIVYKSETLSFIVRLSTFVGYLLLKFWWVTLIVLIFRNIYFRLLSKKVVRN